jgi:hypothetical protein
VKSLTLLLSLEADILSEGHYGVFRGKKEEAPTFCRGFFTYPLNTSAGNRAYYCDIIFHQLLLS